MRRFSFVGKPIPAGELRSALLDPAAGGYSSFEGWVRNHNEGLPVRHLEYEAFEELAVKEGERIIAEAIERFGIEHAACVHRIGDLAIGEMAVWVGVSARHRHEAFLACRYIIDEVKHRVPIWKKEHYENGDSGWVNCERCAGLAQHDSGDPTGHSSHGGSHRHHPSEQTDAVQSAADGSAEKRADLEHPTGALAGSAIGPRTVPDYSRQMALKEVGAGGQARLRAGRVLVIGCGGLGVPVISYLAGAGIGRLTLVDGDLLEPSNLHRQTFYSLADCGQPKAQLAAQRVRDLNPDVDVRADGRRLDSRSAEELIAQHDIVIDCTDNFATQFLLNDFCVKLRKPVVFASVYQYEGQIQVVRADRDSACLRCVWPEATRDGIVGNCAEAGVLGPVPGTFGALQAFEALKILLDLPGQLNDELLVVDLLTYSVSRLRTTRAQTCPQHALVQAISGTPPNEEIEVSFDSLDQASESFDVIDIREPIEVRERPTPCRHSRHIPLAMLLHGEPRFAPARKTLLVCASGRRSLAATQQLRARGLAEVYSLRGGVSGLRAALET